MNKRGGEQMAKCSRAPAARGAYTIPAGRLTADELQAAKTAARGRYARIAELLKAEAGVVRHYEFNKIAGLAWTNEGQILAPAGVTRRQLYVLAHECGHIVLHGTRESWTKPSHVKEHEAETYALRAFARYGLEVPEKSARWARGYVGQWIMKDSADGIPICPMAKAFALGERAPHDPLPAVDGKPVRDFSKQITRLVAEGNRIVQQQTPLVTQKQPNIVDAGELPNACGTCWFYKGNKSLTDWTWGHCKAFQRSTQDVRNAADACQSGKTWRPHPDLITQYSYQHHATGSRGFWARLGDAIIDRIAGRKQSG